MMGTAKPRLMKEAPKFSGYPVVIMLNPGTDRIVAVFVLMNPYRKEKCSCWLQLIND